MRRDRYDLVIIGMGSAGMVAAEFAATLGIRVAAIERHRVGGDCLWTGCVPSKALLAAAKVAHHMRHADDFGIEPAEPRIDPAKVFARIHAVQARIAQTDDSPERFRRMGIELLLGEEARVAGPHAVEVGGRVLETRAILVATGSVPVGPPIPGLEETGFLTSETFWERERPPASIVALGGGPIAMELGQGLTRLGIPATVVEREQRVLTKDEPELVDRLVARLRAEGVDLRTGSAAVRVSAEGGRKVVHTEDGGRAEADEVVVCVGRIPQVAELGLEQVGVEVGAKGVVVDGSLRTSVPSIAVAGDVAGRFQFTHSAGYEGVRAVRNLLFPGQATKDYAVPWCTFTDPELAHAGMTSAQAVERFGPDDVEVHRRDLSSSDRARAEGADDGMIAIVTHRDRIVGAHVLAPSGGEVVHELALAISQDLKLAEVGSLVHAYPTIATDVGQLGAEAAFAGARRYRALARLGR